MSFRPKTTEMKPKARLLADNFETVELLAIAFEANPEEPDWAFELVMGRKVNFQSGADRSLWDDALALVVHGKEK